MICQKRANLFHVIIAELPGKCLVAWNFEVANEATNKHKGPGSLTENRQLLLWGVFEEPGGPIWKCYQLVLERIPRKDPLNSPKTFETKHL